VETKTSGIGGMMGTCQQCGKCCEKVSLGRINNYTADQKEYLRAHGAVEDQGFFLIPFKCPHLIRVLNHADNPEDDFINHACVIHDTKPKICKQFDGKQYKNHALYWVPRECEMRK
jgi:Fe-S-cluster containining protein